MPKGQFTAADLGGGGGQKGQFTAADLSDSASASAPATAPTAPEINPVPARHSYAGQTLWASGPQAPWGADVTSTMNRMENAVGGALASAPAATWQAFTQPATPQEAQEFGGGNWLTRGVRRLTVDPAIEAGKWWANDASKVTDLPGAVLGAAPEAIGQGAGNVIAGKAAEGIGKQAVNFPKEVYDYTRRASSMNEITKAAAGVYQGRIQPLLDTLRGVIQREGAKTLNQAIEADKMTNKAAISGAPVVATVTKSLEETGHEPTPQTKNLLARLNNEAAIDPAVDQTARTYYKRGWYDLTPEQKTNLSRLLPDDLKPQDGGQMMSLQEATHLRSDIGSAASRADRTNPKLAKVLWGAYNELGEGMANRVKELQGTRAPYDHYNNEFRAYYELNKGVTGSMQQSLMDRHDAIPKLKEFAGADLTEIKEAMDKYGLKSSDLDAAQKNSQSVLDAHAAISGKFNKGLYRMIMSGGVPALAAASVYALSKGAGLYGLAPLAASAYLGSKVSGIPPQIETGQILRKLSVDPEAGWMQKAYQQVTGKGPMTPWQVRTPVEGPKTFDYSEPTKADLVQRAQSAKRGR